MSGASPAGAFVERFGRATVLVVGDVMLDRFTIGRVQRISPEAPVPVVEFRREEFRLGGAANVAHTIRALGATVRLVGLVGDDAAGVRLRRELEAIGIPAGGLVVDAGRPTTTKQRIVTERNQQVARIDYEDDREPSAAIERSLVERVEREIAGAAVVVASDYLKGAISEGLIAQLVAAGRRHGLAVLVDPKIPHLDRYRGATLLTPNHHEAALATAMRIRTSEEARAAARAFRTRAGCESVLITRGEHGMWLLDGTRGEGDVRESDLPAVAREVADVTGAGDTVIGTIALALAAGAPLHDAAVLANHAAGIVVGKFGPATVTPEELARALAQA
jgi:D-beta-D-heptose 7-phosphate kinase/D-beta-D-heptose 1-phosphate adenosyltransferase